jgi:hypothetical protein
MTRAVTLAEIADTNTFIVDGTNNRVGIASTIPTATLDVNGVVKATSFTGNATGLTGTPDIAVRNITGVAATFTGVLTYEDVTNIDSIGIITARSDVSIADKIVHTGDTNTAIRFPAADTFTVETAGSERLRITSDGKMGVGTNAPVDGLQVGSHGSGNGTLVLASSTSGVCSVLMGDGATGTDYYRGYIQYNNSLDAMLFATSAGERFRITSGGTTIFKAGVAEKYYNTGTTLGAQPNNPLSYGNVLLFTGNESGNKTINFTGVHATLSNGETVSFTAIITPNNSGVINVVQVDGQAITIKWSGGSAPSAGASGQDIYTFQILKTGTGTSDYTVFGAAANYA